MRDNSGRCSPAVPSRLARAIGSCSRGHPEAVRVGLGAGRLGAADSGLLLLGGFDRDTLGDAAWRRRIAYAPQFHENHVLSGTFAFNVLLGRGWPPSPADLQAAAEIATSSSWGRCCRRCPPA